MSEKQREKTKFKESSSNRLVKVHHYRFAKFMAYLKDHNATIKIHVSDKEPPIIYSADTKEGGLSFVHLLMDALNIPDTKATEYTRKKIGLTDYHSNKDQASKEIGKVIDSITFYLNSDGPVDEIGNTLTKEHPFSVRNTQYLSIRPKNRYVETSPTIRKQRWNHYFSKIYRQSPHWTLIELSSFFQGSFTMQEMCKSSFPFFNQLQELDPKYNDLLRASFEGKEVEDDQIEEVNEFVDVLNGITTYYDEFQNKNEAPATVIPGYWDFLYPYNKKLCLEFIKKRFSDSSELLDLNKSTIEDFINHRYEILWLLVDQNLKVESWEVRHKALLFWTMLEYESFRLLLTSCRHQLFDDLRFIIYSSKDNQAPDYQHDSINLDELCHILSKYNFRDGIRDTVQISGINLIKGKLFKYPEHHTAKGSLEFKEIYPVINEELKRYFYTWISDDLNIPPQFRYRYTEN